MIIPLLIIITGLLVIALVANLTGLVIVLVGASTVLPFSSWMFRIRLFAAFVETASLILALGFSVYLLGLIEAYLS